MPSNCYGALHGRFIALAHSARLFALALVDAQFQSVSFLLRPKKSKCSSQLAVLIWKTKVFVQEEFRSVSSPPVDAQSPLSFVPSSSNPASCLPAQFPPRKPRLRRSVARGGALQLHGNGSKAEQLLVITTAVLLLLSQL